MTLVRPTFRLRHRASTWLPWGHRLAADAAGAAAGVSVSLAVPMNGKLKGHAISVPAAVFAVMTFGVIPYLLDDGDLKVVLAWVRRVARPRS